MPTASRQSSVLAAPGRLWSRLAALLRNERSASGTEAGAPIVELRVEAEPETSPVTRAETGPDTDPNTDTRVHHNDATPAARESTLTGPRDTRHTARDRHRRGMFSLVESIAERLDVNDDRTRQLVEEIAGVPASIAPLPELGRTQTGLLESIRDEAARTSGGVEALGASIREDRARFAVQDDLIDRVTETLRETTAVASHTHEALTTLQATAEQLSATTGRLANALQKASERANTREQRMMTALDRTHRWTVAAVGTCGAIATLALIGIIVVLTV